MASETHDYKGHRITLSEPEVGGQGIAADVPTLLLDDEPLAYGQLPGGEFFLHDYAYDWVDDLVEVAKRFIDHQERAAGVRERRAAGGGEG